jgi:hypothetical protein
MQATFYLQNETIIAIERSERMKNGAANSRRETTQESSKKNYKLLNRKKREK